MGALIRGYGRVHGRSRGREQTCGASPAKEYGREAFPKSKVVYAKDAFQIRDVRPTQVP